MNALPEQSLYVGDVYSAGMEAMLMDVPGAYCDLGVPGVRSLEELRATLSKLDA
jgi:hypothetical protein